jgi:pyridoxal phosphate enzyme (YggS family)
MHNTIENILAIKEELNLINSATNIIAVSKTFDASKIKPLVNFGHIHFGENKVQEAIDKWTDLKKLNEDIKLHLIGKLQTNKVKFCLPLFDYIHSLDNLKLAEKISSQQTKLNFKPKIFVQVNIGNEIQKNGISVGELDFFLQECKTNLDLNIIGLMCIPPDDGNTKKYFEEMHQINKKLDLKELSMGMSSDYMEAINNGATFIRVGSRIFGERT